MSNIVCVILCAFRSVLLCFPNACLLVHLHYIHCTLIQHIQIMLQLAIERCDEPCRTWEDLCINYFVCFYSDSDSRV